MLTLCSHTQDGLKRQKLDPGGGEQLFKVPAVASPSSTRHRRDDLLGVPGTHFFHAAKHSHTKFYLWAPIAPCAAKSLRPRGGIYSDPSAIRMKSICAQTPESRVY